MVLIYSQNTLFLLTSPYIDTLSLNNTLSQIALTLPILGTYSCIDSIDNHIKNFRMKYRCYKYCHSPMFHALSIALVSDYGMYLKVTEGDLDHKCKYDNIVDFCTFCNILSNQMIRYNPTYCKYSGDATMRTSSYQNQATRDNIKDSSRVLNRRSLAEEVQLYNLKKKK